MLTPLRVLCRLVRLYRWHPPAGVTREVILHDDGAVEVLLSCGVRCDTLTIPAGKARLGGMSGVLDALASRVLEGYRDDAAFFAAAEADQSRREEEFRRREREAGAIRRVEDQLACERVAFEEGLRRLRAKGRAHQ